MTAVSKSTNYDTIFESSWIRASALVAMFLAAVSVFAPTSAVFNVQILLFLAILLGAVCLGLAVGLSAATVGFALLLWRQFQTTGGLAIGPAIQTIIWFAVAKFAVVLIALQRRQNLIQRSVLREAEAQAGQQALLLREMTHRTQNDMHRLYGMLNAQARANPASASVLTHVASRLLVQTRLNERLAMRGSQAIVESRIFLEEIGNDFRNLIELDRNIGVVISAENHPLSPAVAADLGLIVNELITNALKHGFPASTNGVIRIIFSRIGEYNDLYELTVTDNGVGYAAEEISEGDGLGLLQALASQLRGRIMTSRSEVGGTRCRLLFPVEVLNPPVDFSIAPLDDPKSQPENKQQFGELG